MNTKHADLIIVGAGILGLSAAIQAREQGLSVLVFEKDAEAIGATRRNFGVVGTSTLSHPESIWRQYAVETRQFYQRIQEKINISLQPRQGLYLANTALQWQVLNEFSQRTAAYQINANLLSPQQLGTHFSYLKPTTTVYGALEVEGDYSVEPDLLAMRLLQYAAQLGVEIQCNACVVKTRSSSAGVWVEIASGQHYQAAQVMICHGEITQILYPEQLKRMGMQRCSLQMALTEPYEHKLDATIYSGLSIARYPAFEVCPSYLQLKQETEQGIVADYGIHILLKQNRFGQLIVGDSHEYQSLDAARYYQQREVIHQYILNYCKKNIGLELPPIERRWTGYYLSHPDQLACINEVEPNIYLISSIGGKGMTTAAGFIKNFLETHIF